MAAPVVADAAALLLQANPGLTPPLVKAILQYSAQPLPGASLLQQGAGLVNIEGAVRLARALRSDIAALVEAGRLPVGTPLLAAGKAMPLQQSTLNGQRFNWSRIVYAGGRQIYSGDLLFTRHQGIWDPRLTWAGNTVQQHLVLSWPGWGTVPPNIRPRPVRGPCCAAAARPARGGWWAPGRRTGRRWRVGGSALRTPGHFFRTPGHGRPAAAGRSCADFGLRVLPARPSRSVTMQLPSLALTLAAAAALACPPAAAQVAPTNIPSLYLGMFEYLDPFVHAVDRTRVVDVGQYWPPGLWEPFANGAILFSASETLVQHAIGRTIQGAPARLEAFSTNHGNTFWAEAISTHRGGPSRDIVGGQVSLVVGQTYIKQSADAELRYTFNAGSLDLAQFGATRLGTLAASVNFSIYVQRLVPGGLPETLWQDHQFAELNWGYGDAAAQDDDLFVSAVGRRAAADALYPVWTWACLRCDGAPGYGQAGMFLDTVYTQSIDLSGPAVGEEFAISFHLSARANDALQGETWAYAFARDPLSGAGGPSFSTEGLLPTNRGHLVLAAVPEPATWALSCAGLALLAMRRRLRTGDRTGTRGVQHRSLRWTP